MKKLILFLFIFAALAVHAQIKILTTGNVGIKNLTPAKPLHVTGSDVFTSGSTISSYSPYIRGKNGTTTASSPEYSWVNDSITGIFHPAQNTFAIATSGYESIRIDANRNVGIKTTNPLSAFQVNDSYIKTAFGSANASGLNWGTSYIGFNAVRQSNGYWLSNRDGSTANGGSIIYGGLDGSINFALIANTGNTDHQYDDANVSSNTIVKFGTSCFIATGTNNPPSGCKNYFKGWKTIFENSVAYKGTINIDLSNTDPRLFTTGSTQIVLYNTISGQYEDIKARSFIQSSDASLKQNVADISNSIDKLTRLRPVSFNWNGEVPGHAKSFGFLAQEVEQVIPELVFTDDSSHLKSMNYIALVPYLVQAIKEQQEQIKTLQDELSSCCTTGNTKDMMINSNSSNTSSKTAFLMQNVPNPFSTKTVIRYYIPETSNTAKLMIFDMQGKLIKTYSVSNKKEGYTEINGGEMQPGMYMYSLIIDGKELDTKRMILTE